MIERCYILLQTTSPQTLLHQSEHYIDLLIPLLPFLLVLFQVLFSYTLLAICFVLFQYVLAL